MENSLKHTNYITTDNNIVLNTQYIRWIGHDGSCFKICMMGQNCDIKNIQKDTFSLCKKETEYYRLQHLFGKVM